MARSPSLCGVILAAGASSRMGTDKALLPWPPASPGAASSGQTFLSAAIQSLIQISEMVIVVAGQNQSNIETTAYANGASVVINHQPDRGQFSSLQIGLQEVLNHGRDAAIVTLVDRPPAKVETLKTLLDAFVAAAPGIWSVVPQHADRHGHPILLGREMIEIFLKAPAVASARDLEHQHQQHIQYVAVTDSAVTLNVNTPQEYAALASNISAP